jgi:hypothetical protein
MKRHNVCGTSETYVTQFEGNRRGVYLALDTARDGANSQHTVIRECQEWLNQAQFDRDTARFTFTYYCDKFIQCYNDLEHRNVFTNEYLKVDKFLSGITNSSFHSIKTTIIADNADDGKMNDLQPAIVYAKTLLWHLVFYQVLVICHLGEGLECMILRSQTMPLDQIVTVQSVVVVVAVAADAHSMNFLRDMVVP